MFDSLYALKIESEDTFKTLKKQLDYEGMNIAEICPNCGEKTGYYRESEPWKKWESGLCEDCQETDNDD